MNEGGWHYARDGVRAGPVTRAELDALAARGAIGPDDPVWHPGFGATWKPAREVEGLPLAAGPTSPTEARRVERAFGPLVAGIILDLVDLITIGPAGFLIGFPVGVWLGWIFRFRWWQVILCGLVAGTYCVIPYTNLIPVGTVVGAFVQYREMGRRRS
ncbi:MAG: DUF4339 domain-containing protein [Lentisphaerae bacterium]|nr:DUF4339 domain-containing protein [Lentisphaerota bacterium]